MIEQQKLIIEQAWDNRELLNDSKTQESIRYVIEELDKGRLRVSEPVEGKWIVHEWIKKAVILYFPIQKMKTIEAGPMEYHDKIPLKKNYSEKKIRICSGCCIIWGHTRRAHYLGAWNLMDEPR